MGYTSLIHFLFLLLLLCCSSNVCLVSAGSASAAVRTKASKASTSFDKDVQRRRNECAANATIMQPCIQDDVDDENCILKCVSLKCYNDLFPEPIEDGEVISHLNTRLKRCLREEVKLQKALEAQQEIERRRGESL